METKTAVEYIKMVIGSTIADGYTKMGANQFLKLIEKVKEMEKEQNIEFLRWFDMQSPIVKAKLTFSELYDKFYLETYNKQ
jgi:hypothetical protein